MNKEEATSHYQEENPTGACEAGCVVCVIMAIATIVGCIILWRIGF